MFFYESYEIFKNTFFYKTISVTPFDVCEYERQNNIKKTIKIPIIFFCFE